MASQEVGHSTWFRSCIPIISVKLIVCGARFIGICRSGPGRRQSASRFRDFGVSKQLFLRPHLFWLYQPDLVVPQ